MVEENGVLSEILGEYEVRLKEYEIIISNHDIDPSRSYYSQDNENTSTESVKSRRQANDEKMPELGEPFFNTRVRHFVNSPKRNKTGRKKYDHANNKNGDGRNVGNHSYDSGSDEKYSSRPYSPAQMQIPHTIELYRVRESELLDALEGVVKRVTELEEALRDKDAQNTELQEKISAYSHGVSNVNNDSVSSSNEDIESKRSSIVAGVRAAMSAALESPAMESATTSHPGLSDVMNNTRSTNVAAEARLAMSNILNLPEPDTTSRMETVPESAMEKRPHSVEAPKFPVGSRVAFLWTNALQSAPIPWPGTVQSWSTPVRCNIPESSNVGDIVEVDLGNGSSEQVKFVPGSEFKIFGKHRLQFPINTKAGKTVKWNNIRSYDILLDKTDKITRIYEHELRRIQEGDVVPDRDKLLAKARRQRISSIKYVGSSNISEEEGFSDALLFGRDGSPMQDFINMFSPNRLEA